MSWRTSVGRFPALWVLSTFFVLAGAAALTLDDRGTRVVATALVALLVLYCWARPTGGWDVFLIAAAPNAVGEVLEGVAGAPEWVPVVLIPASLWLAHREDRRTDAGTSAAGARSTGDPAREDGP